MSDWVQQQGKGEGRGRADPRQGAVAAFVSRPGGVPLPPTRLPARPPALHPQVMLQDAVAAVALMESSSCPLQEGPLVGGMASSSSASAAALGDVLAGGGGGGSGSQPFLKDPDVQYAAVEAALLAALRGGGVFGGNLLLGFGGGGGSGDWG